MAKSFVKKNKNCPFRKLKSLSELTKLRDNNNFFCSALISFWIFKKSTICFFDKAYFSYWHPLVWVKPLLTWFKLNKTWFFHNLTMKQTYFYLVNTFIDFKKLFKFAINQFIHQDTENCLNILFGNIFKETRFSWLLPTKTSTGTFLVAKKKL